MLRTIQGDLLDFPSGINVICHQANCKCTMGGGIAAQIKKRYPQAYEADCDFEGSKLGKFSLAELGKNKFVANLYGQDGFGTRVRHTNYEALHQSIEELFKTFESENVIFGFPYGLGCGLGGGCWKIVSVIIETLSEKYSSEVIIVYFS